MKDLTWNSYINKLIQRISCERIDLFKDNSLENLCRAWFECGYEYSLNRKEGDIPEDVFYYDIESSASIGSLSSDDLLEFLDCNLCKRWFCNGWFFRIEIE